MFIAAFAVILFSGSVANCRTFLVSTASDGVGINTLRGAILAANAAGGNNTIILTRSVYQLTLPGSREDAGRTGDLDITRGNLTIVGPSASRATITAVGLDDRVFHVLPNAHLKLENLIITGGSGTSAPLFFLPGENGGGINNAGVLTLNNCLLTRNVSGHGVYGTGGYGGSSGGDGGGIYNRGKLVMNNCQISENGCGVGTAGPGGSGGGIANTGSMTLNQCSICFNSAGRGGRANGQSIYGDDGGDGGGIYNSGTALINFCDISHNTTGEGTAGAQLGVANGSSSFWGGTGGSGGVVAGFLIQAICKWPFVPLATTHARTVVRVETAQAYMGLVVAGVMGGVAQAFIMPVLLSCIIVI